MMGKFVLQNRDEHSMPAYYIESESLCGEYRAIVEGTTVTIEDKHYCIESGTWSDIWLIRHNQRLIAAVVRCEPTGRLSVTIRGYTYEIRCLPEQLIPYRNLTKRLQESNHTVLQVRAPMPGLVKAVHAHEGVSVRRGENLIVLEAMKMENFLRAPISGIIRALKVEAGTPVEKGQVLCLLEAASS